MWDFDDLQTSISQNPLHQYSTSGTFDVSLIVTGSNNCVDTVIQSLTINPLPIPMFTNSNACENGITYFTDVSTIASGSNTAWLYDFNSLGSSTDQMPEFTFSSPGTYSVAFSVTSNLGCEASVVQDVIVLPSPIANFSINPNPALALQDVVFTDESTGNQLNNWYWNFGDGEASNNQNPIHDYNTGGIYTVIFVLTQFLEISQLHYCRFYRQDLHRMVMEKMMCLLFVVDHLNLLILKCTIIGEN